MSRVRCANASRWRAVIATLLTIMVAPRTWAVDEIQVYNADIAEPGQFTLQQHLNYVWQGSTTPDFPGGLASYQGVTP